MKILMVLTSHDKLGDTGKKTGFWLEEFAAPYYVFKDAHAEITLASPLGGQPPIDPNSDAQGAQTDATKRFKADDASDDQAVPKPAYVFNIEQKKIPISNALVTKLKKLINRFDIVSIQLTGEAHADGEDAICVSRGAVAIHKHT